GVLNDGLVAWLCELNLDANTPRPRFHIDSALPDDLNARIDVDRALLGLGVPLPLSYFHRQYGRPSPAENDEPLRFDDANFYQYHLQFGVLTVNEVRERLGLPPVAWGDQRTATPEVKVPGGGGT